MLPSKSVMRSPQRAGRGAHRKLPTSQWSCHFSLYAESNRDAEEMRQRAVPLGWHPLVRKANFLVLVAQNFQNHLLEVLLRSFVWSLSAGMFFGVLLLGFVGLGFVFSWLVSSQ